MQKNKDVAESAKGWSNANNQPAAFGCNIIIRMCNNQNIPGVCVSESKFIKYFFYDYQSTTVVA